MTIDGYHLSPPMPSLYREAERAFQVCVGRDNVVVHRSYGQTPGEAEAKAREFIASECERLVCQTAYEL